jgi:hypothetical protein
MKFRNPKEEKVNVRFDSPNGHHYWVWVKPGATIDMPENKTEQAKNLGFEPVKEVKAFESELAGKPVETKMRK